MSFDPLMPVFLNISDFPNERSNEGYNQIYSIVFNLRITGFYYPVPIFFYQVKAVCRFYRISALGVILQAHFSCAPPFAVDLGAIRVKDNRRFILAIENANPHEVRLRDILLLNLYKIAMEVEVCQSEGANNNISITRKIGKREEFSLAAGEWACISLGVASLKEERKNGTFEFFMNEVGDI